jgi:hypothetical protein
MKWTHIRLLLICIISYLFITGCRHSSNEFSKAITEFNDTTKGIRTLCFYPSTLEMLNLNKDSSFSAMIKEIKKLKILTFKSETDTVRPFKMNTLAKKIRKESFVDLMQVRQNDYNILVFMKKQNEKPHEFVGIVYGLKEFYILDLMGNLPRNAISSLVNGNFNVSGLSSVLNFKRQKNPQKNNKEKEKNGDNPGNKQP